MSTENNKDWILCRSYRFPNKCYYFNVHNGESIWAGPEKALLNTDKSTPDFKEPKINLNSDVNTNNVFDEVENKFELNYDKSQKQDNQQSETFITNKKSLLLHSQIHTPIKDNSIKLSIKDNKQTIQLQDKKEKKKVLKNCKTLFQPVLDDGQGHTNNTLNGIKCGQDSFTMCNKPVYNRQRKVICDPHIKFQLSQDSKSEDKESLSLITNKIEDINLLGSSSEMQTGENECDNFIKQHDQKWFIFRNESQNEEIFKFQPFGRNSICNNVEKPLSKNMATIKHETKDICIIVIDLNVLLNDFQFVNDKVLQDTRYRLVIPNAVISKLKSLAEMKHKSHQLMVTAQDLIWKIPTQSRHIILEPEQPTATQQIINCCKKIKNLNYNMILLTNDADLYTNAIDQHFTCYMIQDVKEGLCPSLFTKPHIHNQDKDINNNLFLQKPEEIAFNFSQLITDVYESYPLFEHFYTEKPGLKEIVNEKFEKYSLTNCQMASFIILRTEDYMCTFTQIMETFMSDLLLNESINCDFCSIPQAVDALAQLYPDSTTIQIVAYRMAALYNLINKKNKLETKYKADILIKMVGCGKILVESIKALKPNSDILLETEHLLDKLLQSIENPNRFDNELEQSKIVRTCSSSYGGYDIKPENVYYNGHYTDINGNEELSKQTNFINNRIIRTTGKNLNSLIISNNNEIVLDVENNVSSKSEEKNNFDIKINLNIDKEDITKQVFDSSVHENAFTVMENAPKVIRNFDTIKTFEEKIGNKLENIDTKSNLNLKDCNNIKDLDKISETYTDIAYQTEVYNSESVNDKLTENLTLSASNDSGLGKGYCDAYLVIKEFTSELSSTLKIVYEFINDTSQVLRQKKIKPEKKREIFDKAYKTYHRMSLVVDNLKNILKRENDGETTVVTLLQRAGSDVNDKIINKYKEIVTAYLEQIDLLQQALKIIYNNTNSNLISNKEVTNTC
ncbi:PREDICTED: uncharacterized protein LOC106107451 isoform X2 [Papilio polytes]|uniref:uncharacterized protein LOC106107451 isoform X2 n=1 Tax=Papilio polytes TaxID=76194 RepID=UPI000676AD41|nr:PREDICTED: uncharacterized protein LOC106107451 isoform X2 [Papilio polytes]